MIYYKVNYSKLRMLKQIKYYYWSVVITILILILFILSIFLKVSHTLKTVGYIKNDLLYIKLNYKLSDKIKQNNKLSFNNIETEYKIDSFNNVEIINDEIIQEVIIKTDKYFQNNEVGEVILRYDKERLINYLLKLIK